MDTSAKSSSGRCDRLCDCPALSQRPLELLADVSMQKGRLLSLGVQDGHRMGNILTQTKHD